MGVNAVRRGPLDILHEVRDALGESGKNLTAPRAPITEGDPNGRASLYSKLEGEYKNEVM